ncbi:hypothetical protein EV182_004650, partial [Spiromyces aspiralis]
MSEGIIDRLHQALHLTLKLDESSVKKAISYLYYNSQMRDEYEGIFLEFAEQSLQHKALGVMIYDKFHNLDQQKQQFLFSILESAKQPSPQGAVAVEARASISPPCTPVRRGTGTGGSGRSSASGTPIRAETTISLDDPRNEAIKKWAEYMEPITYPAYLDEILEMAGLKTAYDQFVEKFDVIIDRIMAALAKEEEYLRKGTRNSEAKGQLRPEELLEAQFTALCNVMLECLEAEVSPAQLPAVINKFQVGGNTHMPNSKGVSKKRVDIALVRKDTDSTSWSNVLLNIEIKSDADRILHLHRGRYAWYAAEEWPRQVRHYLLGGTLARSHLYVYYNDRNRKIYEASVGKLLLTNHNER